jgi:GH43 family beta-xylosidase
MGPTIIRVEFSNATNDVWAINGTILQHEDSLYFLYSAGDGQYQSIFIALLENPWTIMWGTCVAISTSLTGSRWVAR